MAKEFVTKRVKEKSEEVNPISVVPMTSMDNITTITIPVGNIQYNPFQSRFKIDEESIKSLKESILSVGLINPITVAKRDGYYVVVSGHRRFEALKSLGYNEIQVLIKEMDDIQLSAANISENAERKGISPIEVALAYLDLKNLLGNNRKVAETLKISEASASNYISMALNLAEEIIKDLKAHPEVKSVNFLTKLSAIEKEKQIEFYEKVKSGKIKINTAIMNIAKMLMEEKQGNSFFEDKLKGKRNKAKITINGNKILLKGSVISFNKIEKEELLKKLNEVMNDFYVKYDKAIKEDDKRTKKIEEA